MAILPCSLFSSLSCLIQVLKLVGFSINSTILCPFFFFCMHTMRLCSWNFYSFIWSGAVMLLCYGGAWKEHVKKKQLTYEVQSIFFLIYFLYNIYEKVICAITVAFHISLLSTFLSFSLLILQYCSKAI